MAHFSSVMAQKKIEIVTKEIYEQLIAAITTNLPKLSPDDLKIALEQKYCPIHNPGDAPIMLGAKGIPVKIILKNQPVFLCCKECIKKAKANPDTTLAKAKEMKNVPFLRDDLIQIIKQASKAQHKKK